jgi:anti-sigma-K factor RskA
VNDESTYDAELVTAYLDGECAPEEQRWIERRLAESSDLRELFVQLGAVRDAVRALPPRAAPSEFWARLLTDSLDRDLHAARRAPDGEPRRRVGRWVTAAVGSAAAAAIAAIALVPQPEKATPPVAAFTDAHAVRTSLQDDAVSSLAPLGVTASFRR